MADEREILLIQRVPLTAYKPRAMLNGLPKSGVHMLEQMVATLLTPSEVGRQGTHWLGTYKWHSFTMQLQNIRQYLWRLSCMERGTYLMGHSGYLEDVERMLRYGNIAHIFIYRDLRDVAVSQAHHVWDKDKPNLRHEHKDLYQMMTFDEALLAVIQGVGPYPGVVERWAAYAPWLEAQDVLALSYGYIRSETGKAAGQILLYLLQKATELLDGNDYGVEIAPDDLRYLVDKMVKATEEPSTTFRRGVAGGWRDEFKPEHVEAFKETDADGWLVKLGFEENQEWE